MKYPIVEIFDSVQGEGIHMGKPVTFIRMAGCNLSCPWCDTDFSKGTEMSVPEILDKVTQDMVIITGGEPTMYNLSELLGTLAAMKKYICIETNGTNSIKKYKGWLNWVSCSPKPQVNYAIHPETIRYIDELKYVVDETFDISVIPYTSVPKCEGRIWLQPEAFTYAKSCKRAMELVMQNPSLRLGLQAHKVWEVR